MSRKIKIIEECLDNYVCKDVRNTIMLYYNSDPKHKTDIFDNIWQAIILNRENPSMEHKKQFHINLVKYLESEKSEIYKRQQFIRNASYLLKLAKTYDMYQGIRFNFKTPVCGIIRCGKCGTIDLTSNLNSVKSARYSYQCNTCRFNRTFWSNFESKKWVNRYLSNFK